MTLTNINAGYQRSGRRGAGLWFRVRAKFAPALWKRVRESADRGIQSRVWTNVGTVVRAAVKTGPR